MSLGSADEIFAATFKEIRRYDSAGTQTLFYVPALLDVNPYGLAYDNGDLYFSQQPTGIHSDQVVRSTLPDPGPLLVPGTTKATEVTGVKATLQTTFNPEGKPSTAHFEYLDKASFEAEGEEFKGPNLQVTPESEATPGGFENQTASSTNVCTVPTEATCLKPETDYVFRAIAKNEDGEVTGGKAEFTTKGPHEVGDLWTTEVGTDSARLHAEVNALGVAGTARFEYIPAGPDYDEHGFQNATATPTFDIGSAETTVARSTQLSGLEPGTAYHYRLVVEDPYFAPVSSAEAAFATFALPGAGETGCPNQAFRTGQGANLPDCRGYELVSPLDKANGDILTRINATGYPTDLEQSSPDGGRFAFSSYRAFGDPASAPYTNQYTATRTADGWSSEKLDPPLLGGTYRDSFENEFRAFSADLSQAWMLQEGDPTLDPCAPAGVASLYRRSAASGAFEALSCAPVGQVAKDAFPATLKVEYMPELQGTSADGSKALIRISDALTPEASTALVGKRPINQLYESVGGGQIRLVSVLPGGQASDLESSAGTALSEETTSNQNRLNSLVHAISADGTRVFWSTGVGNGPIYLRLNSDQVQSNIKEGKCTQPTRACTVEVSGTVSDGDAFFQAANPQGSAALFSFREGPLAGNLYRFEAATGSSELIAEGVQENILGASEDLSRVYFASTAASAQAQSEGASPGRPNVYLAEAGTLRFVATLSSPATTVPYSDVGNAYGNPNATTPIFRTARVAPDGRSLVFMSNSPALAEQSAGYDNTDLASGQAAFEVYLFDADAGGGAGALRCLSCNPSGARPLGQSIAEGTNGDPDLFAVATIPLPLSQFHQPRYLSEDGNRVFFQSFEALVLGDTNGKQDVYQWEAAGSGSCGAGDPAYVPASEGCLELISSGRHPSASRFLDASPSGADAFFATAESLVSQDYGLIDVYDARVGGGFPPPPAPPAACEGEACQGPYQPPVDPTPASSSFQGAGNVVEGKPRRKPCPKGKVRRKGRCVKKHRKGQKHHQRRDNHERRTHR